MHVCNIHNILCIHVTYIVTAYSVEVQRVKEDVRRSNSASQGLEKLPRADNIELNPIKGHGRVSQGEVRRNAF